MDAAEGGLLIQLPSAAHIHHAERWLPRRSERRSDARPASRSLLCRLLLGADGAFVRWWRHESFLDCRTRNPRAAGESYALWPDRCPVRWRFLRAGRCMDVDSKWVNKLLTGARPGSRLSTISS